MAAAFRPTASRACVTSANRNSEANFPVCTCYSGEACPQSGYWKIIWNSWTGDVIRHFEQGEIMPTHMVEHYRRRIWPLSDKITQREERMKWGLLG